MKSLLRSEPALIIGLVQAALALAVAFGLNLSPGQVGAVTAFAAAVLALVVRQAVVSPASALDIGHDVARKLDGALTGGAGILTSPGEAVVHEVVGAVGGLAGALAQGGT